MSTVLTGIIAAYFKGIRKYTWVIMMLCTGISEDKNLRCTFRKDIVQTIVLSGFLFKVKMSEYSTCYLIKDNNNQNEDKNMQKPGSIHNFAI